MYIIEYQINYHLVHPFIDPNETSLYICETFQTKFVNIIYLYT